MPEKWRKWKHITKLDPDKKITPQTIETIIETDTDAVMISGTQNIKREDVLNLVDMLQSYDIPKILEPVGPQSMIYKGIDWIFVPSVFNTNNSKWINGLHKMWIQHYGDKINWEMVVPEAYIILNPKSAAARYSGAKVIPTKEAVAAAVCAERMFKFPIVYIEYSGTYGDPTLVKAVSEALSKAHLIYGGGINTKEKAEEMSKYATIVVGNTIYEGGSDTFINTMRGSLLKELQEVQIKLAKLKKLKQKNGNGKTKKEDPFDVKFPSEEYDEGKFFGVRYKRKKEN